MRIHLINDNCISVNNEKIYRSCRDVYFYKNYAIKIEIDLMFGGQCKKEYAIWNKLENEDRKYFTPILGHRFTKNRQYVIQPKLKFKRCSSEYKAKYIKR